jgi:hypothetical protein
MPTANSWPARWAVVILEKTWAAQESGLGACVDGDACVAAGRAEAAAAVAAPEEPPEVGSHPAQARASARTPPIRVPATWCLTMPPDFLRVTLPIPHVITGRHGQGAIAEISWRRDQPPAP